MKSFVDKYFLALFVIFSVLFVILVGFSFRSQLTKSFDEAYIKDLHDHSQWTIAKATRIISDNDLYQVAALDLVRNGETYKINPEVPPFGKYLIGISILLFNNAYIISFFLYIASILLFYLLARQIFQNRKLETIATIIFLTEPIIFSQSSLSLLDLPQLFVFLIHSNLIVFLVKNPKLKVLRKLLISILAGISLGLFLGTKIGLFGLAIIAADAIILLRIKNLILIAPILISAGLTYAALYLPYFLQGNSPIEFLRAQKWMINFYAISKVKPIYGIVILTLATGFWKFSKVAEFIRVNEWTILWPAYLLSLVYASYQSFIKRVSEKSELKYLAIYSILLLSLFLIVPFWVRYLVILIPFLIIIFVHFLPKINKNILLIIFVVYATQVFLFLSKPLYPNDLSDISSTWKMGAYQDLYEYVDGKTKKEITRSRFLRNAQEFDQKLETVRRDVLIVNTSKPWEKEQKGIVKITYMTDLGNIDYSAPISFVRENGIWKIKWSNNLLFNDPNKVTVTKAYTDPSFGTLQTESGTILAQAGSLPYFSVTPGKIENEEEMQKQLQKLTGLKNYDQEAKYKVNAQPGWSYDIGFLKQGTDLSILEKMKLDPGISYENKDTIVFTPVYFRNRKLIDSEIKKQKIKLSDLYPTPGGEIIILVEGTEIQKIFKESQDGKDLVVKIKL